MTGVTVRVASLQDIVDSKRFAGRHKDHNALPERERLLEQRRLSVSNQATASRRAT